MASHEQESRNPIMVAESGMVLQDKTARDAFIRKVYIIFSIQLTIMLLFVAICYYVDVLEKFMLDYDWLFYVAHVRFLITSLLFFYISKLRRKVPWNYICVVLCTESMATVLAYFACLFYFKTILISLAVTALIVLATILITCRGIYDLTHRNRWLCVLVLITLILMIIFVFAPSTSLGYVCCAFGTVAFSLCLLQCTQLILGRKYQYALKSDEYLAAAVFFYISVIILIMCLSFAQVLAQV